MEVEEHSKDGKEDQVSYKIMDLSIRLVQVNTFEVIAHEVLDDGSYYSYDAVNKKISIELYK